MSEMNRKIIWTPSRPPLSGKCCHQTPGVKPARNITHFTHLRRVPLVLCHPYHLQRARRVPHVPLRGQIQVSFPSFPVSVYPGIFGFRWKTFHPQGPSPGASSIPSTPRSQSNQRPWRSLQQGIKAIGHVFVVQVLWYLTNLYDLKHIEADMNCMTWRHRRKTSKDIRKVWADMQTSDILTRLRPNLV